MGRFNVVNQIIRAHARGAVIVTPDVPNNVLGVDKAENTKSTGVMIDRQGTIKTKLLKPVAARYIEQADTGAGIYDGNPIKPENFAHEFYMGEVL